MEQSTRSRLVHGTLPRDVEDELSSLHIEKVWELLEEKFCFNVKVWKKEFNDFQKQIPSVEYREAFVQFGHEQINPILNLILRRKEYHPTWRNILTYIVKKH
jgi:hypothetical protein